MARSPFLRTGAALAALALAVAVPAQSASPSTPSRMTPELLWQLGRVSDPQLAPDGRSMLVHVRRYEIAEDKGATQIFHLPLGQDGIPAMRQLTFEASNWNARWSSDGKRVAFLSSRSGSAQIWLLDLSTGGEARQLTDVEGGVSNMSWAPDDRHFAFTAMVQVDPAPGDRYADLPHADAKVYDDLMVRHWDQWRDNTYSHLFVVAAEKGATPVDLMAGQRLHTPLPPFGGGEQIAWSPDGKWLCYATKDVAEEQSSTDSELRLVDVASGDTQTITTSLKGYDLNPVWSPDGSKIAFASMARDGYESDRNRILVHDVATGGKKELTENFDLSVGEHVWAPDGGSVYFTADFRGGCQVFRVPADGKSEPEQVTRGRWNFGHPILSPDGKTLYALRQHTERPYEVVSVDLAKAATDEAAANGVARTDVNGPIYANLELPEVEGRWFEATDGKYIHSWVIKPPGFDPNKKYPMLLYCQGGPQSQVGQWFSYRWNFHLMAAQGYVVLAVNRRGLPGFGTEWNEQISKDWGGQAMQDLLSATDAMLQESYVDRDRVAAIGASFGGYTVYWMMGHDQEDRFCSMVAHCGVFDLRSMYLATEELFFVNWDLGGPYWQDEKTAARYAEFSPSSYIENWDTPLLVIHGARDYRVPLTQGLQAFTAAQERGVKSRLLYYPDEGHWVLKPQNGLFWHREFFRWLDETCKNRDTSAVREASTQKD
jgi:dipeptidyl aminopeptidase/acylaminoacyl peptidase